VSFCDYLIFGYFGAFCFFTVRVDFSTQDIVAPLDTKRDFARAQLTCSTLFKVADRETFHLSSSE